MNKIPSLEKVKSKCLAAISKLQREDSFLLKKEHDINERTVTHRLAMHLTGEFKDYDVDCEYNRMFNGANPRTYVPKRLSLEIKEDINALDTEAYTVYPDIIVHKRGTDTNLLVIEAKMSWKNSKGNFDKRKLRAYKEQLGYSYALYLEIEAKIIKEQWLE